MRIDDHFSPSSDVQSRQVERPQQQEREQKVAEKSVRSGTDSASLSSLGVQLARALATEPPDSVDKIERLREAVTNGTFSVPAEEVAQSLVDDALGARGPEGP